MSADVRGWPMAPLGDFLLRIEAGKSPDLPDTPARPGEWGVLKVSAVNSSGFRSKENKALGDTSRISLRDQVRPGDLLFSRANTPDLVGAACIATPSEERLLLSDKILRLVVNPELADSRFVCVCLTSHAIRRQIVSAASGSSLSMQNVSQGAVVNLVLRWPSLAEQRRIVKVIDAMAAQERAIVRSIAKLERLGEGMAAAQLADIELGRFEDVIEYGPRNGIYKSASSYGIEGTPIVRIDSFRGGPSDFTRNLLRVSLTAAEVTSYGLTVGDIVINRVNTPELVGKSTAVRELVEPTVFESNMMRCKVRADRAVSAFVEMWLGSVLSKKHFRLRAKSAISQASINGDDVRDCPFPRIEVPEQHSILERLAAVTAQRHLEEAELAKVRDLKRGLVDDLLNGRS